MIKNPYHPGRAIEKVDDFFGRDEEVERIFSLLNNMESVSIVGERRIGKTSLLNYISTQDIFEMHILHSDTYIFIFLDFQDFVKATEKEFLLIIVGKIKDKITDNSMKLKIKEFEKKRDVHSADMDTLIDTLSKKYNIVLLCDEFGYSVKNKNFDLGFFTGLRALANHNFSYVVSTLDSLGEIIPKDRQGSGFLTIFPNVLNLELFSYNDALNLIKEPAAKSGINFSKEDIDCILKLSGYHPCFIQIACFDVFEKKKKKKTLSNEDHNRIKKAFDINTEENFNIFWDHSSEEEKSILKNLADDKTIVSFSNTDKEHLEKRNLIFKENGHYKIFSYSFKEFVKKISDKTKESIIERIIGIVKLLMRILKAKIIPFILFMAGTSILISVYIFGRHTVVSYMAVIMYALGGLHYFYEWVKKIFKRQ